MVAQCQSQLKLIKVAIAQLVIQFLLIWEVTNNSRREITAVRAILKQRVVFQGRCNYHPRCDVGTCKTKVIQTVEDHDIAEIEGYIIGLTNHYLYQMI